MLAAVVVLVFGDVVTRLGLGGFKSLAGLSVRAAPSMPPNRQTCAEQIISTPSQYPVFDPARVVHLICL